MPTLFLFLFSSSSCSIPPLTGEDREKKEKKRKEIQVVRPIVS
jgi:hypothetical protein